MWLDQISTTIIRKYLIACNAFLVFDKNKICYLFICQTVTDRFYYTLYKIPPKQKDIEVVELMNLGSDRKKQIQVTDRLYYTLYKIPLKRFALINVQLINCLHNVDHFIFLDLMHHIAYVIFCINALYSCELMQIMHCSVSGYQLCKL